MAIYRIPEGGLKVQLKDNDMDIKLIALDLDRTTLNAQSSLSYDNRAAIERAIKKGIHVCIASGRSFDTLPSEVVSIPGIEYAITSNGAAVYKIAGKECMRSFLLTPQSVRVILEVTSEDPVTYEAFIDGKAYASKDYVENPQRYGASDKAVRYVQSTRTLVDDIISFLREHENELDCMDIIVNDDVLKRDMMERIRAATKDVYLTSSIKQLLEISYKDAGKKSGLEFLAKHLGIESSRIAAFGDADNDIDMIEYAGCGIAVENASDGLKAVADYITLHHDKDGLAYAFDTILHI